VPCLPNPSTTQWSKGKVGEQGQWLLDAQSEGQREPTAWRMAWAKEQGGSEDVGGSRPGRLGEGSTAQMPTCSFPLLHVVPASRSVALAPSECVPTTEDVLSPLGDRSSCVASGARWLGQLQKVTSRTSPFRFFLGKARCGGAYLRECAAVAKFRNDPGDASRAPTKVMCWL
jgi:hypothetical protein